MAGRFTLLDQKSQDDLQIGYLQKIQVYRDQLWAYCTTANGLSMAVQLQDFFPSFLLKLESMEAIEKVKREGGTFGENLNDFLNERDTSYNSYHNQGPNHFIEEIASETHTPFVGFTNNEQHPFLRVYLVSHSAFYTARRIIEEDPEKTYKPYHHKIDIINQLLIQTQWKYQIGLKFNKLILQKDVKRTHCSVEGICSIRDITIHDKGVGNMLQMACQVKMISRDGVLENKSYRPDIQRPEDRIVSFHARYSWSKTSAKVVRNVCITWLPDIRPAKDEHLIMATDERHMLSLIAKEIDLFDPDMIVYHSDPVNPWMGILSRMVAVGLNLHLERLVALQFPKKIEEGFQLSLTRHIVNAEGVAKKAVFVSHECYDLYTLSTMKAYTTHYKTNSAPNALMKDPLQINKWFKTNQLENIIKMGQQDTRLLQDICTTKCWAVQFAEVARLSDTDFTRCVSGGVQPIVMNTLTRFCCEQKTYINPEMTYQEPLKYPVSSHPPTYKDPADHPINIKIRQDAFKELERKDNYRNANMAKRRRKETIAHLERLRAEAKMESQGDGDEDQEEEEEKCSPAVKEAEGGNVILPAPGLYHDPIAVLDFASLYPSIHIAFNICYRNLVYDPKYLNLPGVKYIYIQINNSETVVSALKPGIFDSILKIFVAARKAVKKQGEEETDPHMRIVLSARQNSLKIVCNGTYGFTGATEESGGKLPVKTIMFMITSLGRYLQKTSTDICARHFDCPVVYGDTDSIFVLFWFLKDELDMDKVCNAMDVRYRVALHHAGIDQLTWEHVKEHYAKRRKPLTGLDEWKHMEKIYAVLYIIFEVVASFITSHFPKGVSLDFEVMLKRLWLGAVKKCYAGLCQDPGNPSLLFEEKPIKNTGMSSKRREWTSWTRSILIRMMEMILFGRETEIEVMLRKELDRLASKQLTVDQLMVSKGVKTDYSKDNLMHVQVQLQIEREQRCKLSDGSRFWMNVIRKDDKTPLWQCGTTPETVKENPKQNKLDLLYIIENQFRSPVMTSMRYNSELFDVDALVDEYSNRIYYQQLGVMV